MMKTFQKYIPFFVLLMVAFSSCHKDYESPDPVTSVSQKDNTDLVFQEINESILGQIVNNDNNPVQGAQITIYSSVTSSNALGIFKFNNTKLDPQGTLITIQSDGQKTFQKLIYPVEGISTIKISVPKSQDDISLDNQSGGTVDLASGGSITFGPFTFTQNNGSTYTGNINVSGFSKNSTDVDFGDNIPGGFIGIDDKGRHRILGAFCMAHVSVLGGNEEVLSFSTNSSATLSIPIPNDLLAQAETEATLWLYDESEGYWFSKNTIQKNGSLYSGEISDLGYYMVAKPFPLAHVCGTIESESLASNQNYKLIVKAENLPVYTGYTSTLGDFCSKLPAQEDLVLEVISPICNDLVYNNSLGPFDNLANISTLTVPLTSSLRNGTITCNGGSVSNVSIVIYTESSSSIVTTDETGQFEIINDYWNCEAGEVMSIRVIEQGGTLGELYVLDGSNSISINKCEPNCQLELTFDLVKDDPCEEGNYDRVIPQITGGSGSYALKWQDGSADETFENPQVLEHICLNVIDLSTGCEVDDCISVSVFRVLSTDGSVMMHTSCAFNSGEIEIIPDGEFGPFEYEWEGPAGFSYDGKIAQNLEPGFYSVTTTDSKGCTAVFEQDIVDPNTELSFDIEEFCDVSVISIEILGGLKPYDINWSGGLESDDQLYVTIPGEYTVTVTDANGCIRVGSIGINSVGLLPDLDPVHTCEKDKIIFTELNPFYSYFYIEFGSSEQEAANFNGDNLEISVFESSYRFQIGTSAPTSPTCEVTEEINLPKFTGLISAGLNHPTCDSCEDGFITYEYDETEPCTGGCVPGGLRVLEKNTLSDVTLLNEQHLLPSGRYYLAIIDMNTECYIGHAEVELD